MDKSDLILKLLSRKANENNTIDLNAYESGLQDMYETLTTNNKEMIQGAIKKLERDLDLEGHTYTMFEIGNEISEIKDVTNDSKLGWIHREFEIHYRDGTVIELIGGIFTLTRNKIAID